jgi:hypothetical protein
MATRFPRPISEQLKLPSMLTLLTFHEGRESMRAMSALPPKADMCGAAWDVRFGPKADMSRSFDDRVGSLQERFRNWQPKRLGGL